MHKNGLTKKSIKVVTFSNNESKYGEWDITMMWEQHKMCQYNFPSFLYDQELSKCISEYIQMPKNAQTNIQIYFVQGKATNTHVIEN